MAGRYPIVTAVETVRALQRAGWVEDHQTGSHKIFKHGTIGGHISVPMHAGRTLSVKTLKNMLLQARLTPDEFRRLL